MNKDTVISFMKKHYIISAFAIIIILGGIITAFEGDTEKENTPTQTKKVENTTEKTEEKTKEDTTKKEVSRCLDVPVDLIEGIESGLEVEGGGKLQNVQAVKSNDFESVYFIGGKLDNPDFKDSDTFIFTTNRLELGKGLIGSANSIAKNFSVWPTPRTISGYDDGMLEVKDCVQNKK